MIVPAAAGWATTTMVKVTGVAPEARLPRLNVSLPPASGFTPPVADWNFTLAGSVSVTTAAGSVDGPVLAAVIA